jgi:hypothetical protein
MRVFFFTLKKISSFENQDIYADMLNEFMIKGHSVDYFFPSEGNIHQKLNNNSLNSIKVGLKFEKTNNFIGKYLSYLVLEKKVSRKIRESKNHYDLLMLSTPSIFQLRIVKTFKRKFPKSKIILLLKDIFPDNALDLGIIKNTFPMFLVYKYFKVIENKLYNIVDKIGVMTELNKKFLLQNYPDIENKIFLSPNSIYFYPIINQKSKDQLRIPKNKIVITFIGNLGIPQNPIKVKELIDKSPNNFFFIIIGTGSRENEFNNSSTSKVLFINNLLSQKEIDQYLSHSNYGLVMLNGKFTVPNFPSKILSYLNANLPILSFTNNFNDLKVLIQSKQIPGFWFNSNKIIQSDLYKLLEESNRKVQISDFEYAKNLFSVQNQVNGIINEI